MRTFILFVCVLGLASFDKAFSAYCSGKPHPDAKSNTYPIKDADLKLIGSTKNGKLFSVGDDSEPLKVLHVWGTPYEMGYAQGTLLKDDAADFMNAVWVYLEDQVVEAVNGTVTFLKDWFIRDVANLGLDAALDLEILATSKFSGDYFLEEIKGLGDACGVDYKKIQKIHMLGELTKGACSMIGAWGDAVANTPIDMLQVRALDWNTDGPFKNYPQLTVYHPYVNGTGPEGKRANAFINVGFTGWIGSMTGMSSAKTAISEIGVSFPDDSFVKESRFGVPFTFDFTLDDAINRIANAHRTCNLILGVGDGKEARGFRGIQYSAGISNFYDDQNMRPVADWHPKIKDVVYYGMDWLCPGFSKVLSERINANYGMVSPDTVIHDILAITQTGSLHIAVYDLTQEFIFVGLAKADSQDGPEYAYERQYTKFNAKDLFMEQPPK